MTDSRRLPRSSGRHQTYEQWQLPSTSYEHPSYSDDELYYNSQHHVTTPPSSANAPFPPTTWGSYPPPVVPAPQTTAEWLHSVSSAPADSILYSSTTTAPSAAPTTWAQQQSGTAAVSHPSPIYTSAGATPPSMSSPNSASTDESGRFHCTYPSCESPPSSRVFTRKSDFRRHMDKHTRPYQCPYTSCRDLPGFGWVGGLNRHLEEIHNAAAQHKCPFSDCKRHVKGFNRVANLKKHLRVHENGGASPGGAESGEGEDVMISGSNSRRGRSAGRQGRDGLLRDMREAEHEVVICEREESAARQRRIEAVKKLEQIRREVQLEEQGSAFF